MADREFMWFYYIIADLIMWAMFALGMKTLLLDWRKFALDVKALFNTIFERVGLLCDHVDTKPDNSSNNSAEFDSTGQDTDDSHGNEVARTRRVFSRPENAREESQIGNDRKEIASATCPVGDEPRKDASELQDANNMNHVTEPSSDSRTETPDNENPDNVDEINMVVQPDDDARALKPLHMRAARHFLEHQMEGYSEIPPQSTKESSTSVRNYESQAFQPDQPVIAAKERIHEEIKRRVAIAKEYASLGNRPPKGHGDPAGQGMPHTSSGSEIQCPPPLPADSPRLVDEDKHVPPRQPVINPTLQRCPNLADSIVRGTTATKDIDQEKAEDEMIDFARRIKNKIEYKTMGWKEKYHYLVNIQEENFFDFINNYHKNEILANTIGREAGVHAVPFVSEPCDVCSDLPWEEICVRCGCRICDVRCQRHGCDDAIGREAGVHAVPFVSEPCDVCSDLPWEEICVRCGCRICDVRCQRHGCDDAVSRAFV